VLVVRSYGLLFVDPATGQYLGGCVLDVTVEQAADELPSLPPTAMPGAEWLAAAVRRAWAVGANPGGQVAIAELPPDVAATLPRDRLMLLPELEERGVIERDEDGS